MVATQQPPLIPLEPPDLDALAREVADAKRHKDLTEFGLSRAKSAHKAAVGAYDRAIDRWGKASFGEDWQARVGPPPPPPAGDDEPEDGEPESDGSETDEGDPTDDADDEGSDE